MSRNREIHKLIWHRVNMRNAWPNRIVASLAQLFFAVQNSTTDLQNLDAELSCGGGEFRISSGRCCALMKIVLDTLLRHGSSLVCMYDTSWDTWTLFMSECGKYIKKLQRIIKHRFYPYLIYRIDSWRWYGLSWIFHSNLSSILTNVKI